MGAVCTIIVLSSATPAQAHTALEGSSPADDARVRQPPGQITLDFTGPIRTRLARVTVQGPDGQGYESGAPEVGSDKVWQPLATLSAAGTYEVRYRVIARDGHPLSGKIRFVLTRPAPAATRPIAADPGIPAWEAGGPAGAQQHRSASRSRVPQWASVASGAGVLAFVTGAVWLGRRVTHDID